MLLIFFKPLNELKTFRLVYFAHCTSVFRKIESRVREDESE